MIVQLDGRVIRNASQHATFGFKNLAHEDDLRWRSMQHREVLATSGRY